MAKIKKSNTTEVVAEKHFHVIDEYFNNGYSGVKAVMSIYPNYSYGAARVLFNSLMKDDRIQGYVVDKRRHLRAKANIEPEQVIDELINWVYADPTQFMALTPDDVKALPSEVRRCIQTVNYRKTDSYDKDGNKTTREVMDLKFVDKTKAVEILNKMLGFYALDNRQKGSNINVENLNVAELKVLQQILNKE